MNFYSLLHWWFNKIIRMKLLVRKEFEMWLVQWKRYFFGTNADLLKATLTSFFSEWPPMISIWHRSLIPAKLPFINQRSWMLVELFPVTVNFSGVFGWTSKGKKKPSVIRKKPTYFSSEKSYFRRSERIRRISVSISNWENGLGRHLQAISFVTLFSAIKHRNRFI